MKTATVLNTLEMVKYFPGLDDDEMTNLLNESFRFTDGSSWLSVRDLVRTIRKEIQ
jgi:hypothetical protein